MSTHEVVTRSNRGQWETVVEGRPELSQSFSTSVLTVGAYDEPIASQVLGGVARQESP
ncbi:MAG: hypothetical protein NT132_13595 [Microbacterium sp.]|uniref:hypothetical protein n=1 Tax=Microbacterium sp. TaxID=51671 RepID=UPI00262D0916|nr:hypothetical protein [Microbacterium sp.]MCX6503411.1 hypothetical protein [Microbacterium sp.]